MVTIRPKTDDDLDQFEGVMIPVTDPFVGSFRVPGWKCKTCGWTVGAQGLPPSHECPTDGIQQQCDHTYGETYKTAKSGFADGAIFHMQRCTKCDHTRAELRTPEAD